MPTGMIDLAAQPDVGRIPARSNHGSRRSPGAEAAGPFLPVAIVKVGLSPSRRLACRNVYRQVAGRRCGRRNDVRDPRRSGRGANVPEFRPVAARPFLPRRTVFEHLDENAADHRAGPHPVALEDCRSRTNRQTAGARSSRSSNHRSARRSLRNRRRSSASVALQRHQSALVSRVRESSGTP